MAVLVHLVQSFDRIIEVIFVNSLCGKQGTMHGSGTCLEECLHASQWKLVEFVFN